MKIRRQEHVVVMIIDELSVLFTPYSETLYLYVWNERGVKVGTQTMMMKEATRSI